MCSHPFGSGRLEDRSQAGGPPHPSEWIGVNGLGLRELDLSGLAPPSARRTGRDAPGRDGLGPSTNGARPALGIRGTDASMGVTERLVPRDDR